MAEALKWFNVTLTLLGSLAAFGALNKMRWRETRPCIAGAMLLIAVGLGAQWLGELRGDWARVADTCTFGGFLVLIVATQKVPSWFLERWANPVASVIAILVGLVLLAFIFTGQAQAQSKPEREPIDCTSLAQLVARVAVYRDVDANRDKVLARILELNAEASAMHRETIAREIRRLWREALPINDAVVSVYVRCQRVLGDMGRDS
jgi:hypothetical protein